MKKILSFAVFLLIFTVTVEAQKGPKFQQNVESMRIAFITKELDLQPEEAQKFWPIYNQYRSEQKSLKKSYKTPANPQSLSDKDADDLILASLEMEEKEVDLKRKYYQKMKEVLPVQKIAMLRKAEREFKENLIQQLNERRRQRRKNRNGNN